MTQGLPGCPEYRNLYRNCKHAARDIVSGKGVELDGRDVVFAELKLR
jgi:hypothetical protein